MFSYLSELSIVEFGAGFFVVYSFLFFVGMGVLYVFPSVFGVGGGLVFLFGVFFGLCWDGREIWGMLDGMRIVDK
jgi:hypothetical protein